MHVISFHVMSFIPREVVAYDITLVISMLSGYYKQTNILTQILQDTQLIMSSLSHPDGNDPLAEQNSTI